MTQNKTIAEKDRETLRDSYVYDNQPYLDFIKNTFTLGLILTAIVKDPKFRMRKDVLNSFLQICERYPGFIEIAVNSKVAIDHSKIYVELIPLVDTLRFTESAGVIVSHLAQTFDNKQPFYGTSENG